MSALLKGAQLAEQMGVSRLFVTAMKAAGYRFQYGTQTTLRHALSWREQNQHFRVTDYVSLRPTGPGHSVASVIPVITPKSHFGNPLNDPENPRYGSAGETVAVPAHVAAKDRRRCGNGAAKTC